MRWTSEPKGVTYRYLLQGLCEWETLVAMWAASRAAMRAAMRVAMQVARQAAMARRLNPRRPHIHRLRYFSL